MWREVGFAERYHEARFRPGNGQLSSSSSSDRHGQCNELAGERWRQGCGTAEVPSRKREGCSSKAQHIYLLFKKMGIYLSPLISPLIKLLGLLQFYISCTIKIRSGKKVFVGFVQKLYIS